MKKLYLFICLSIVFVSCNVPPQKNIKVFFEGKAQGTFYAVTYFEKDGKNFHQEIDSILKAFDKSVSIYDSLSIISRVNRNDSTAVLDKIFIDNFNISKEIYNKTKGAFDITVGPLVNAWGFGLKNKAGIDSAMIDSLLKFVNSNLISIIDNKISKKDSRIKIDFNAIAQGYSVEVIAEFLESKGIGNYLVEIGGEIIGKGKKDDDKFWLVGIDKPSDDGNYERELKAKIILKNKALATSGNYRKFYIKDGIKYSHTINPKTGYPVQHSLLSVTVITDDCSSADAYATSFMVMGLEKTKTFLSKNKQIDAYLIYSDENGNIKTFFTEGINEILVEEN